MGKRRGRQEILPLLALAEVIHKDMSAQKSNEWGKSS
jgi:hypothetical protein